MIVDLGNAFFTSMPGNSGIQKHYMPTSSNAADIHICEDVNKLVSSVEDAHRNPNIG
jgi:hypothetical protein